MVAKNVVFNISHHLYPSSISLPPTLYFSSISNFLQFFLAINPLHWYSSNILFHFSIFAYIYYLVVLSLTYLIYSHLFMVYPLHNINYEQPQYSALIEQSLDHWYSLGSTFRFAIICSLVSLLIDYFTFFRGHSWTGAASLSALIGRKEAALGNLTFFLNGGCLYLFFLKISYSFDTMKIDWKMWIGT